MPRLWPSNPKLIGERGECAFTHEAMERGLLVAKPYGDSAPYDFIVDSGVYHDRPSRLLRVQVRVSRAMRPGGWYTVLATRAGLIPLTRRHADFLAAFIPRCQAWYIIPIAALKGIRGTVAFRPNRPTKARWEKYRDAWHLLGAIPRDCPSVIPRRPKRGPRTAPLLRGLGCKPDEEPTVRIRASPC